MFNDSLMLTLAHPTKVAPCSVSQTIYYESSQTTDPSVRVNRNEIRKCIETCLKFKATEIIIESTGVYHEPFVEEFSRAGDFDI